MKADLNEMVTGLHGKYCKQGGLNSPIFAKDSKTGTQRVYHIHNPYTGERTARQKAVTNKFTTLQATVATTLADPTQKAALMEEFKAQKKYNTLRGYVFAKLYAEE